ncbi:MAG: isoprenylcysteine carboxylmethyltransferase family protein [Candidatus Thorarchaeota archaeon]|nr:isoprenylcysteine carboxylmethyltransferase family protein [Candidatus Thorarchaeota archaeon]
MTSEIVFRVLFTTVFVAFWIVRMYYVRKTRNPAKPRSRAERREAMKKEGWTGIALVILTPIELIIIILYILNPIWMMWATLVVDEGARWLGFAFMIVSLPFMAWVHRTLGKHYSYALETKIEQAIVREGPYARLRHPLYSAHNLFNLGMILFTVYVPLIIFAVIGIPITYSRMKSEESMLVREFGDDYTGYMHRTGRIFPKVRRSSSSKNET